MTVSILDKRDIHTHGHTEKDKEPADLLRAEGLEC